MPLELLWLLLPVAAASGWLAARRDARRAAKGGALSPEYFRGINFLLNEQPDKAIETFTRMLEINSETVEPHLALGSLFRRQGDVDRAIRIHQNLIARPALPDEQRNQALFELGRDYLQAGLLDRAENLFRELSARDPGNVAALRLLNEVYEQENEWEKAITAASSVAARTRSDLHRVIAHYYCELAGQALAEHDTPRARKLLKRAYSEDRDCVRASILAGELARARGDCRTAIKAYKRVEKQDRDYLAEVVEPMLDCYERLGQSAAAVRYLREALGRQGAFRPVMVFAGYLGRVEGGDAARRFVADYLRLHPSLPGLAYLLKSSAGAAAPGQSPALRAATEVLSQLLAEIPAYSCGNCGFRGKTLHWQCPSCRRWNSVKPYQGQTA